MGQLLIGGLGVSSDRSYLYYVGLLVYVDYVVVALHMSLYAY